MTAEKIEIIHTVRKDIGNILVHWTRKQLGFDLFDSSEDKISAFDVLKKILSDGMIKGGTNFIKGGYKCVCFTETPVSEIISLFSLSSIASETGHRPRYEPFGIGVHKEWLFKQGGRPVIYQLDSEYEILPESIRWRHCRYAPNDRIDFTWEREWRIKTDSLKLDPDKSVVIVPTNSHIRQLMDCDFNKPPGKWVAVSLKFLGLIGDWEETE